MTNRMTQEKFRLGPVWSPNLTLTLSPLTIAPIHNFLATPPKPMQTSPMSQAYRIRVFSFFMRVGVSLSNRQKLVITTVHLLLFKSFSSTEDRGVYTCNFAG